MDIIFSCPDTITLITVANTLIIANPGFFPWTRKANNYGPNRKCPSVTPPPPSESSGVCDSPLFSSLQPQLPESVLQWVPKTKVSAPRPRNAHPEVNLPSPPLLQLFPAGSRQNQPRVFLQVQISRHEIFMETKDYTTQKRLLIPPCTQPSVVRIHLL